MIIEEETFEAFWHYPWNFKRWSGKKVLPKSRGKEIASGVSAKKNELFLMTFELIKLVIPLDSDNAHIFKKVTKAGDTFFEESFNHDKLKEDLHWIQNSTQGICQLCPVYPWVGHATNSFILALEAELQGGQREYWTIGSKKIYQTEHFLADAIDYCSTSTREIEMCSGLFKNFDYSRIESKKARKRMEAEIKKVFVKYHQDV